MGNIAAGATSSRMAEACMPAASANIARFNEYGLLSCSIE